MFTTILGRLRRLGASVQRPRAQANVIPFPVAAARGSATSEGRLPVSSERELTILSYDNVR